MQPFISNNPKRLVQKCNILSFCVHLNRTQSLSILLVATLSTKVATSSQFAVHWRQLLRHLCLAGHLNIRMKANPQDLEELRVRSLLRQVTSRVMVKVKFTLEQDMKSQKGSRGKDLLFL